MDFIKTFVVVVVAFIVVIAIRFGAESIWLRFGTDKPTVTQSTAPVRDDVEIEPDMSGRWTNGKQAVYEGCIGETVEGVSQEVLENYCVCASNYMLDNYSIEQVSAWAENVPQSVLDAVVNKCFN